MMDRPSSRSLENFKNYVGIKFQLYNSLFTSLPFYRIEKTGMLLSLFLNICEEGYKRKLSPQQIIEEFFLKDASFNKQSEKLYLILRFIQYVEIKFVFFY
jgi:phosphoenolpyruvate carboxylase